LVASGYDQSMTVSAMSLSNATALDLQVLVLNKHYRPVAVTRAKRAFRLLATGAAKVLDEEFRAFDFDSWAELGAEFGHDVVRTPRFVLRVPRVVLLQIYDRVPRTEIRFSRQNVYLRDGFTCQYCGKEKKREELNLDHVKPRSQGGRTSWENVVCSCVKCNLKKGGRTPKEAGMKLLTVPKKPSGPGLLPYSRRRATYKEWLPFLDPVSASYWNTALKDE
jgi:5-methylcytosine-specific restriction endonuclease McrA